MKWEDGQIVEEAIGFIERTQAPQYQWIFVLAGYARSHGLGARPADYGGLIQAFGQAVRERLLPFVEEALDWGDADAVGLEFERAWSKRKHVQGSDFFARAVEVSVREPLELGPKVNSWVRRVVNAGFVLQELQLGLPFLLPVNEEAARLFGTSMRTLSMALQKAISLDLIRVEKAAKMSGRREARRLRFNYEHPVVAARLRKARGALRGELDGS